MVSASSKGRLLGISRVPFASKVTVLLTTSFTFSGSQYACMKAASCIYTVFYHALGLLSGRLVGVSRVAFASKVIVFLWTSFTFSGSQYACMKGLSYIHTVFYHDLGLLSGKASRWSTGTVRIKSDGFPLDILYVFRTALCLHESFIMHLHCVLWCCRPPKREGFLVFHRYRSHHKWWFSSGHPLPFQDRSMLVWKLNHAFTLCFFMLQAS